MVFSKGTHMKVLGSVAWLLVGSAVLVVLAGQLGFLRGQTPDDLGLRNGLLKPPSATPNSVSSQAALYTDHPQRSYASIAPFPFAGTSEAALEKLLFILKNTPRCVLVTQQPDYLYAQCSTALLRFTDDVEFWLDRQTQVIHVRSASRLGSSDLGVNRARVEKIRAQLLKN
jgi:uncharacterized protein (DUF1499 family)